MKQLLIIKVKLQIEKIDVIKIILPRIVVNGLIINNNNGVQWEA